ncbi:hypothetical protein CP8484711_1276, partial [Chlamydia psittaci 84-8471/1]
MNIPLQLSLDLTSLS